MMISFALARNPDHNFFFISFRIVDYKSVLKKKHGDC